MKRSYIQFLFLLIFNCATDSYHLLQASLPTNNLPTNQGRRDLTTPTDQIIRAEADLNSRTINNLIAQSLPVIIAPAGEYWGIAITSPFASNSASSDSIHQPIPAERKRKREEFPQNENDSFEDFELKTVKKQRLLTQAAVLKSKEALNNAAIARNLPKNTLLNMR